MWYNIYRDEGETTGWLNGSLEVKALRLKAVVNNSEGTGGQSEERDSKRVV